MTKREKRWFDNEEDAASWSAKNSAAGYVDYDVVLSSLDIVALSLGKVLAWGGTEYGLTIEVEL